MSQQPTIGRIVHYSLSENDAESINKRRADTAKHLEAHREASTGVQVHVGFEVTAEDVFPAIVVGTHEDSDNLDLRVLLNGTDILWSPDAPYSPYAAAPEPGSWFWPPRA